MRAFSTAFGRGCDIVPQMGDGDYERNLGVVEAITLASKQCPNASVRTSAERALETIRKDGAAALPTQAYLLMTSMRGWRGERASQIHRSLQLFLAEHEAAQTGTHSAPNSAPNSKPTLQNASKADENAPSNAAEKE